MSRSGGPSRPLEGKLAIVTGGSRGMHAVYGLWDVQDLVEMRQELTVL